MEKLLSFINSLRVADRAAFAEACGTTVGYLRKATSAKQLLRPELCTRIERASGGAVRRSDLRSDWREIWPELAQSVSNSTADEEGA